MVTVSGRGQYPIDTIKIPEMGGSGISFRFYQWKYNMIRLVKEISLPVLAVSFILCIFQFSHSWWGEEKELIDWVGGLIGYHDDVDDDDDDDDDSWWLFQSIDWIPLIGEVTN